MSLSWQANTSAIKGLCALRTTQRRPFLVVGEPQLQLFNACFNKVLYPIPPHIFLLLLAGVGVGAMMVYSIWLASLVLQMPVVFRGSIALSTPHQTKWHTPHDVVNTKQSNKSKATRIAALESVGKRVGIKGWKFPFSPLQLKRPHPYDPGRCCF